MFLLAIVVVLTIHEFSHALTADYLGDPTARLKGRMSLNPLVHLDAIGALAFVLFGFGWAKPVPVDPYNLHDPKRDGMLISLAGPASNLLTALVLSAILRFSWLNFLPGVSDILVSFFFQVLYVSVILAVFNLIPIHPLDGGKILVGLLPDNKAEEVDSFLHRYGMFILLGLLITGSFSSIIVPVVGFILGLLLPGGVGYI
jgi:Zn-dependent protease